ncbi:MAG: acyl-CoA dehydrogenase family protein [Maricaulaceae bacterium]
MALVLDDDQQFIQDTARGFLAERAPISALRKLRDDRDATGFSRALWTEMAEMGWTGVLAPEAQGGAGLGFVAAGLIAEEMGRTLTASPYLTTALMAARALTAAGSETQQARWLPAIAGGTAVIALAVDETSKHRPAQTALAATPQGNGFTLNGAKTFVADLHVADQVIVAARTTGAAGEEAGSTLFLVDPNAEGVGIERTIMTDSRNFGRLQLENVRVDGDAVLGGLDQGFRPLEMALDAGRVGLAAEMTGSAQECFGRTLDYLKERQQFGQAVGSFQALQHRCAHLLCEIELAQSAVLKALQALDAEDFMAPALVAVAKAKAGEAAQLAAREAIQMHGGVGMTDDVDIGFFIKRIQVANEMLGDYAFHADRIAALRGY